MPLSDPKHGCRKWGTLEFSVLQCLFSSSETREFKVAVVCFTEGCRFAMKNTLVVNLSSEPVHAMDFTRIPTITWQAHYPQHQTQTFAKSRFAGTSCLQYTISVNQVDATTLLWSNCEQKTCTSCLQSWAKFEYSILDIDIVKLLYLLM